MGIAVFLSQGLVCHTLCIALPLTIGEQWTVDLFLLSTCVLTRIEKSAKLLHHLVSWKDEDHVYHVYRSFLIVCMVILKIKSAGVKHHR